jgi:hypothetical protein
MPSIFVGMPVSVDRSPTRSLTCARRFPALTAGITADAVGALKLRRREDALAIVSTEVMIGRSVALGERQPRVRKR